MVNKTKTTIYTGVTSDLKKRVYEHKNSVYPGSFTARYKIQLLVYYEGFHSIEDAIAREKQIKAGSRKAKEKLIDSMNPEWNDLYDDLTDW